MEMETGKKVRLWFEDRTGDPAQFREGKIQKIEDGFLFLETLGIMTIRSGVAKEGGEVSNYPYFDKKKAKVEMIPVSRIIRVEVISDE